MKQCKKCNSISTSKWYKSGAECRSCYRKSIYMYKAKKETQKKCLNCNKTFLDKTLGQNKKYCNKSCSEKKRYVAKTPMLKICKKCSTQYETIVNYQKYCSKECRNKDYSKKTITQKERLKHNLRNRLCVAIKNNYKAGSAVNDLGCSIEELKAHLESKFTNGMSWDNYGLHGWHIDHIKPLASFDLTNPNDFKKACHYTNLQPLWAIDNLRKGDKSPQNMEKICH